MKFAKITFVTSLLISHCPSKKLLYILEFFRSLNFPYIILKSDRAYFKNFQNGPIRFSIYFWPFSNIMHKRVKLYENGIWNQFLFSKLIDQKRFRVNIAISGCHQPTISSTGSVNQKPTLSFAVPKCPYFVVDQTGTSLSRITTKFHQHFLSSQTFLFFSYHSHI